jgi:hypothetical protein
MIETEHLHSPIGSAVRSARALVYFYITTLTRRTWAIVSKQARQLFWIFLYLWALLGLFSIYRSLILDERNIFYHEGFAVITAWALAKAILVAEKINISQRLKNAPMIYPVALKSAIFAVFVIICYFVEALIAGIWRGNSIAASVPTIGNGTWTGVFVITFILFVVLLPFTALRELDRDLGGQILLKRFFQCR